MCGIAGFFGDRPIAPSTRRAMLAALANRGPDAAHEVAWQEQRTLRSEAPATAALLHARLSIRDPRPLADQPMGSDDGQIWLCYNGEVYGWETEAAEMADKGVAFHTRSDTEFILRAYQAFGFPGLLTHLRGMFALAILDWRLGKLFLARDRLGLKPLVYGLQPDGIAFGSTVRSVLPWLPRNQRAFHPGAIDAYLAHRYIPAPRTVFSHLSRLENAHYLTYDLTTRKLEKTCYWSLPDYREAALATSSGTDARENTLDELRQAVMLRTVADRPLGVFLSGGIDSAVIASILSASGRNDLGTFTATFPGSSFDESAEAAEVSRTLGLPNTAIPIPGHLGNTFNSIVADLDEPFADPSSIPTWFLARETVKRVTVVLGGDGGDEIFAGYKRHTKHLRTGWRAGLKLPLPAPASLGGKGWRRLADEMRLSWEQAYTLRFSGFTPAQRRYLSANDVLENNVWWRPADTNPAAPLERLLACDLANTLPEYILRKADLCSMAHGLEMRAPLLDHCWLEKLAQLPPSTRYTQPAKFLLDDVMNPLRNLHLFERKKRGFNPPLGVWLEGDLRERMDGLGARLATLTAQLLKQEAIDQLANSYLSGASYLAEQMLQLLLLDESLHQLDQLRSRV